MSRKFPDRWLDYTKFGNKVEGTPFIALKVPLNKDFFTDKKIERFTPEDVIKEIPNLGLMIDLTFTARYYNPVEFECEDVQHKKIYTKGHEVPARSLVNQFIHIVDDFLAKDKNKDKLIGVHCTHGLNRTGYFVCAYMILAQGQSPRVAIKLFNKARSHAMERANYLNSLLRFIPLSYNGGHNKQSDSDRQNIHRDRLNRDRQNIRIEKHRSRSDYRSRSRSRDDRQQFNNRYNCDRSDRSDNWRRYEYRNYDHNNKDDIPRRTNSMRVNCFGYSDSKSWENNDCRYSRSRNREATSSTWSGNGNKDN
ncbi:RNA/RNP complex-1-interacting phosphatase [Topomyia yanbarensis]|uniref:RNA/RNP complex-1-interacting phosphatase n=1 Tax=Topomyia yanbarensis TaxID=2498891 RepID=UPI00273AD3C5|nr:RNA/RNP complex-1-interacting phosphatase [Topomyia yanbarensis]